MGPGAEGPTADMWGRAPRAEKNKYPTFVFKIVIRYKITLRSTEIQIPLRQGIQATFVFSLSKHVFNPNQTFLRLGFSLFSVRGFVDVLKRAFLNFLFFTAMLYYHFTNIINTRLFNKQLGSGPSHQSCLYFQDFQGSNLLNGCWIL